ncbi:MAG: hypothetical protein RI565_09730, partial [Schleiferiaceae bacterium]|nr:hypothetical protein [Schleiferiaceae bacterium]
LLREQRYSFKSAALLSIMLFADFQYLLNNGAEAYFPNDVPALNPGGVPGVDKTIVEQAHFLTDFTIPGYPFARRFPGSIFGGNLDRYKIFPTVVNGQNQCGPCLQLVILVIFVFQGKVAKDNIPFLILTHTN